MNNYLVFNHHSLPFTHQDAAKDSIPDFLKICIMASNAGLKTILVDQAIDTSWFRLKLAPGYFWKDWHDQQQSDKYRDMIRAFRSIATQSPFFRTDAINNGADLFEVTFDECTDYSAVCAAAWYKSPLTSFATKHPWNYSPLAVSITKINLTTKKIEKDTTEIQNFYSYSVLRQYLPKLLEQRNASISSGKEILNNFKDIYPNIVLCGKAMQQLNSWSASATVLNQVKHSLKVLNKFVYNWKNGNLSHYSAAVLRENGLGLRVSGESETVKNNSVLKKEREFWLPSGHKAYFDQHIKMSFGYRLHFYPDHKERTLYVGYIGSHLRLK